MYLENVHLEDRVKKDNINMDSCVMSCEAGKRMDEAKNLVQSLSFGISEVESSGSANRVYTVN
jgi:hypothetical protein